MAKKWRKETKAAVEKVKAAGSVGSDGRKDTELVHVNKAEMPIVDRALKRYGGSGKTNPRTGLKEYATDTRGWAGAALGRAADSGRISFDKTGKSDKNAQSVPTQSTGPTAPNDTFGSPESAAAANASLGAAESLGAPAASSPKPTGFVGMDKQKPQGATEYREGADALGVGGTIAAGIAGNIGRALALGVGEGDKDPLKDHIGKQTGWHIDSEFGGKSVGGPGTKAAANGAAKTGATAAPATSASTGAAAVGASGTSGGDTITVNPDGTVRTQDTSVAGLRAKRRYGTKA